MTRLLILASALALAACSPDPSTQPPSMERVARDDFRNDVSKVCDGGRAVYVLDASSGRDGMVVIDNAPECAA